MISIGTSNYDYYLPNQYARLAITTAQHDQNHSGCGMRVRLFNVTHARLKSVSMRVIISPDAAAGEIKSGGQSTIPNRPPWGIFPYA
jgi:hypothetical protein